MTFSRSTVEMGRCDTPCTEIDLCMRGKQSSNQGAETDTQKLVSQAPGS